MAKRDAPSTKVKRPKTKKKVVAKPTPSKKKKKPVPSEKEEDPHQKTVDGRRQIMNILMCTRAEKRNGRRKTKKKPTAPFTIVKRTMTQQQLEMEALVASGQIPQELVPSVNNKSVSVTTTLNMDQEIFGRGDFDADEKRRVFR